MRVILFSLFISATLFAAPVCPIPTHGVERNIGFGMELAVLHPNHLIDFESTLRSFGPVIVLPVGGDALNLQGLYGANQGLSSYVIEANYQFNLKNPFVNVFVKGGGHYLHYTLLSRNHAFLGLNLGVGMLYEMSNRFALSFGGKMYFQETSIFSLSGGFTYFL